MTGRDAKTILVHGISTVLAGDNETMEKAKSPQCDSLPQALVTTLFPMTDSKSTILPKFEVGQTWRTRGGDTCTITHVDYCLNYPIRTDLYGGHWHYSNGNSCLSDGDYEDDLVSLVKLTTAIDEPEKEPTPAPITMPDSTAPLLPQSIVNGDTPFYVVVVIDSEDGEKLVWETPMPEGATLEAALKQRLRLNPRYSVSYIAECRIILIPAQQS